MSKYADRLMKYIDEHPDFIMPEARRKEMVNNFLKPGLQDLCVSRTSFTWGIPVTFDPKHVVYVWLDALTNYITALGYDPDTEVQSENFRKYWPADVHIIGKDIVRFHSIYWLIFLMALDLPLPKQIFGHPWFNFGTDKMSKSRGNVIYADKLADKFGVDGVRYYALSEMPYASDGSITYESVIGRYNTDLANNLGNLVNRTVAIMINNIKNSLPQEGICDGDIYYERSAEGGITRIMMLVSDYEKLGTVGSIRSSRDYFVDFLANHDAIYVHAGGSAQAYEKIIWRKINNLDGVNQYAPNTFWRDNTRMYSMGYEHSLMTSGEGIAAGIALKGYRTELDPKQVPLAAKAGHQEI